MDNENPTQRKSENPWRLPDPSEEKVRNINLFTCAHNIQYNLSNMDTF